MGGGRTGRKHFYFALNCTVAQHYPRTLLLLHGLKRSYRVSLKASGPSTREQAVESLDYRVEHTAATCPRPTQHQALLTSSERQLPLLLSGDQDSKQAAFCKAFARWHLVHCQFKFILLSSDWL